MMMTVDQSIGRIKKDLAALDRENAWESLDREEVIDAMLLQEIKAGNEMFEDTNDLGSFVSSLLNQIDDI